MSPSKRLEFLETFAFNNVDISQVKARAKEEIKQTNLELERVSAQLQFATKTFETTPKPDFQKFPVKLSPSQTEEDVKTLLDTKHKNAILRIKKTQSLLELLQKQKQDEVILKAVVDEKEQCMNIIKEKILTTENEKENFLQLFPNLDESIQRTQILLDVCLANREAESLAKKIKIDEENIFNLKQDEKKTLEDVLKTKETELWDSIPKDEIDSQIEFWKELKEASSSLKSLQSNLANLGPDKSNELSKSDAELLEAEKELTKYLNFHQSKKCPSCSKRLRIGEDGVSLCLVVEDDEDVVSNLYQVDLEDLKQNISRLKKLRERLSKDVQVYKIQKEHNDQLSQKISELKSFLESSLSDNPELISETDTQYQDMQNYKADNLKLETEISTLKRQLSENIFSSTIISLEKRLSQDKAKLNEILAKNTEKSLNENSSEEEIRNNLNHLLEARRSLKDIQSRLRNFEKDLEETIQTKEQLILSFQQKYSKNLESETTIDQKITESLKVMEENEQKRDDALRVIAKVEKYNEYKKWLKNWENLKSQKEDLEVKEQEAKRKYASALTLRDKIVQAESIAITNIIDNVNAHVALYLDLFFPTHPITIRISPYKEVKGESKPEINLEIDYKGIEHDKTMLSGGEMSRVILAFTLAFAEIQGTPLLLLDECTASLDQELTSSVIEGLKENFGGDKLVLLIAHQVVQGSFDRIVKL